MISKKHTTIIFEKTIIIMIFKKHTMVIFEKTIIFS